MDVEAAAPESSQGRVPTAIVEQAAAVGKHIQGKVGGQAPTDADGEDSHAFHHRQPRRRCPQVIVGECLPSLGVSLNGNAFNIKDYFAEKRGVIIGLPGAFSPMRMQSHVKGFHDHSSELKKRISFLGCLAVNDPYVLKAWSRAARIDSDMTFICDSDSLITQQLGLQQDLTSKGMGVRCKKFALIVGEGAIVKWVGLSDEEVAATHVMEKLDEIFPEPLQTNGTATTTPAPPSTAAAELDAATVKSVAATSADADIHTTAVGGAAPPIAVAAPSPDADHAAMQQPGSASTMVPLATKLESGIEGGALAKHSTMPIGSGVLLEGGVRNSDTTTAVAGATTAVAGATTAVAGATTAVEGTTAGAAAATVVNDDTEHKVPEKKAAAWNYIDHGRDWLAVPGLCIPPTNRQSPINIEDDLSIVAPLGPLDMTVKYDNNSSNYLVENDGHLTRVKAGPGLAPMGSIIVDGETYVVDNFHFHSPSEHTFNGTDERRVVELHIVHVNEDRSKVVTIGVTFEPSEDDTPNPFLHAVLQAPKVPFKDSGKSALIPRDDMRVILSESMFAWGEDDDDASDSSVIGDTSHPEFYRYAGSSTVPPCEENVIWFVKRESEPASDEQLEKFALLLHSEAAPGGNARELHNTPEFNYNNQQVHIVRGSQKKR
eukprot:Lankesteria_metandrocarpae@DN2233_c0_g1_i2.p1